MKGIEWKSEREIKRGGRRERERERERENVEKKKKKKKKKNNNNNNNNDKDERCIRKSKDRALTSSLKIKAIIPIVTCIRKHNTVTTRN